MGGIVGSVLVLMYMVAFAVFWMFSKTFQGKAFDGQTRIIKSLISSAALLFFLVLISVIIFEVGSYFDIFVGLDIKFIEE